MDETIGSGKKLMVRHFEDCSVINARAEDVFAYMDDYSHLSSHMNKSSWMMGGGRMDTSFDDWNGQRVGSHIRMSGRAFGIKLFLKEVVTRREPPLIKIWETVGDVRLLIIGHYRMGIEVKPQEGVSSLRVYIDYDLPLTNAWLGRLFSAIYAKWCVQQMIKGTRYHFAYKHVIPGVGEVAAKT